MVEVGSELAARLDREITRRTAARHPAGGERVA
jgi:hypothetical protein